MVLAVEIVLGIALFTLIVVPAVLVNPLASLGDYPPAIRKRCQELGRVPPRENRFTPAFLARKVAAIIVLVLLLAFVLKHFNGATTFLQGFAISYAIWFAITWWDAIVLDCGLFCHWKRFRIPGTEDMVDAYHDYMFHIKQSCIGSVLGLPACAAVGLLVAVL